jgi:hypothetical protein
LAIKELAVASYSAPSHFLFRPGIYYQKHVIPDPPYSLNLPPCNLSVSLTEDTDILTQMRWLTQNYIQCYTPS